MKNFIDPASLLNEIYNSTRDYGMFTIDHEGRVTSWNSGAEYIIGFSSKEILGQDNAILFTPEDRQMGEPQQEMRIAQARGRAADYRWHLRKDGSRFWADGVLTPLRGQSGKHVGYLKIFRDITDRKIAESELHRVANYDLLTGVPNRYSFDTHAAKMIAVALRGSHPLALHLIDLDGFKQVNDTFGHHAGDKLLRHAAQRMRDSLRESDFIARLGGDEFVVLQPNLPLLHAAAELAGKLLKALAQPFDIDGSEVQVSGSVGIAVCPHDARDLDQLLKKADLALYRAKKEGKGRFHYFTENLDLIEKKRHRELAELRHAVDKKEFWIAYQPKLAIKTGRVVQVEALLRCTNPALAHHPVDKLIELAVEAGLMKEVGYWVLREACTQLRQWKENGLPDLKVSVNMCLQEITDSETPGYVGMVIADTALQPGDLEIELTERQALEVERHGLPILRSLRAQGIRIALDDFGTGYSALSYLRDLPVTAVKLDKSFLVGIPENAQGSAVVKAVMDLSQALGLEVIAEGVENEDQAAFLKEHRCTAFQGFLISKPLAAKDMTAWLLDKEAMVH